MRRTRRDGPGPRQRRVGRDRLPTRNSAGASTTSPWRLPRLIYRRAYGLASDLAESHSHRLAGRLHDAPGAGGMPPRSSRRSAADWPSGPSMTGWWPRLSRMRGRVEGPDGDAEAGSHCRGALSSHIPSTSNPTDKTAAPT